MEKELFDYMYKLYGNYVQYGVVKYFCFYGPVNEGDELCIWDYENRTTISNGKDFMNRVYICNKLKEQLPTLVYYTNDPEKVERIKSSFEDRDYQTRIENLMEFAKGEKELTLVDKK